MSIPVLGAEEDSKGLEQAILAAKKIITIPENYTDFTHNSSEREISGDKIRVWNLNWGEKEVKGGAISVSIGEDGFLYEYNKYTSDENSNGLAKVSKDQAQISAEKFLNNAIPEYIGQVKLVKNNSDYSQGEEYNFTYQKFVNEVPVNFTIINIGINKYSGEVTSFNDENQEIKGAEYPNLEGVIEPAIAEKAYIEKVGIDLRYYSYYDYENKKINIFAGYSANNINNFIDAKTGQVASYSSDNQLYDGNKDYSSMNSSTNDLIKSNQELSKEEMDAIENIAHLIPKEKAESILREASDLITTDMKVSDVSLNKNYFDYGYTWNISFDGAYGRVDAKSGEVISLHCYNYNNGEANVSISKIDAQNIAESFLKKVSPTKFSQTKYKDMENPVLKIGTLPEGNSFLFNFIRQVNGIEFSGNSLNVEIDKTKGKVIGYDNNWYDNVSFPDVSKAISKETAFNKIEELAGFSLQYTMLDKNKVGLVYNFVNMNDNYIIDPISGIRLDFTGKVYKENKLPEYTDISGHWCEKIVKELLDNGYYIDGEKFNPNMNITQINFLKYIYSPIKNNYTDDEFYEMLIQNGVIKKEEKAPNSSVSYEDAAKFVIRYLGYDKLALHPEIFNIPFKDSIEEGYRGYAAMCYALNIIRGDKDGNFNGTHNISNAEASIIIYNLIKNNIK
jgi:hypothetical protein